MTEMKTKTHEITIGALPASRKIYIAGEMYPDIRVPMREIALHPTSDEKPVVVYDTSGLYTDSDASVDITKGLPDIRGTWIKNRGDVQSYHGRAVNDADN